TSEPVRERRETLGGKGANQAVSLAQLGASVALVGVVGDDAEAERVLERARADGIDVTGVIRRSGTRTGLIVEVVDADARYRYFEDLPPAVLLTEEDVAANADALRTARAVMVQLQQPAVAALAAARTAHAAGGLVVLDGAPGAADAVSGLLACADVVRADARETELLIGGPVPDVAAGLRAGRALLDSGPRLAALSVGDAGNVFVWPDGEVVVPLADVPVVDTTGAGDAFTAALTLALVRGAVPEAAAHAATAAAAATVGHAGGRPRLGPRIVGD
ncbi:MAG TPA: PfkB family carbohydrate kinase, partial [Pseudonocardiaceae bacterium]|nr:PfkB family carbohydrate kinase [Pseudonocardiaceae bacterium]